MPRRAGRPASEPIVLFTRRDLRIAAAIALPLGVLIGVTACISLLIALVLLPFVLTVTVVLTRSALRALRGPR